jgi:hypothetical protein
MQAGRNGVRVWWKPGEPVDAGERGPDLVKTYLGIEKSSPRVV